jgi:hypothetical protein
MSRIDYYRAVLFGVVIGVVFISGFYVFTTEDESPPPDQKFSVVDTYKGCDVVQYTPDQSARYTYFLDCTNEMMMGMPYGGTSIKARKEKYD